MNALEYVFAFLFFAFAPLLCYQLFLAVMALKAKIQVFFEADTFRKFAFIIPAHNEEKIIAKTIYSLSGLIYPKNLYDVFVIADNCTDSTASLARSLGVTVLERTNNTEKGKGYALRWAFDQVLASKKDYNAVIVVDADSLISGNYLEVMNYYLEHGSRVIQSSDLVLPEPGNWSVEATRIGFLLFNYVKPLGRKVLHFNMGLRGNGMCFDTRILKEIPWQAWSLTEDVEYGLILIFHGIKIAFAPEATVLAQMPIDASNAESQRSRWEIGRFQIIRAYASKFFFESFRKGSISHFDTFIDLITPPFVNMMFIISSIFMVSLLFWLVGFISIELFLLWGTLVALGIAYLFLGLYIAKAEKSLYRSLLHLPVYAFWKLKVYMKALKNGKEVKWIKTERDKL